MKNKLKKIVKRFLIIITSLLVLLFLTFGTILLTVPISRPKGSVRSYVLRKMPMGTSWDDVLETIDDKGWIVEETDTEHGLCIYDEAGVATFATEDEVEYHKKYPSESRIVGVKAMFVELGEFYGPLHTAVFAYLAFDENDELIEVTIRRDIDGI